MKRWLLSMLLLFSLAIAGGFPQEARFDRPVTIKTSANGDGLEVVLSALAESVGLTPVLKLPQDLANLKVRLQIADKPFREVWTVIIETYGEGKLDYALLKSDIVLVASPEVVAQAVQAIRTQKAVEKRIFAVRYLDPEKIAPFIEAQVSEVQATPIPGQKALMVTGPKNKLDEVAALLEKTDVQEATGPALSQKTFRLAYAKAEDLAKILQAALAAQAQNGPNQPSVRIVADPRTNALIVTGTPEALAFVANLLGQLDRPVQQVSVQVRIQEVSTNVLRSLGLNWQAAGGNLVAAITDAGIQLIFDATRSLASLNIGATLNALERQGLSRKVTDANLTLLSNQTGKIQSGYLYRLPIQVKDSQGNVTTDYKEFNGGVTVEITPQLTPDGEITLKLNTKVTSIAQKDVSGLPTLENIQNANTVLRLKDGQTVVLGGLIQRKNSQSKQGIPFLSDIPLLGALFSQTSNESEDSELLIVIKARRVTEPNDTCPSRVASPCLPNATRP